jgi:signal transduction histidine kinase
MTRLRLRRIGIMLVAATLLPVGALGWLGARILQQDRDIEGQRREEALTVEARGLALDLAGVLADFDARVSRGEGVRLSRDGIEPPTETIVLYQPVSISMPEVPAGTFDAVDADEYRRQDLAAAAAGARRLSTSPDGRVRAAALLRLGAILRNAGDTAGARRAYDTLEALGTVVVAGQPAVLVARLMRCRILEDLRDTEALSRETEAFAREAFSGRHRIDRPTFESYRDAIARWGGPAPDALAVARTQAANALWNEWRDGRLEARGRRLMRAGHGAALAVWRAESGSSRALLVDSSALEAELTRLADRRGLIAAAQDAGGSVVTDRGAGTSVSLSAEETQLPFGLRVSPRDPAIADARESRRRMVLVGGLAAACALMLAAAYGLYRATTRELEVARQQTDFVAAVSHELRTPLTSMRHLIDLLATRSVTTEERRAHYCALLGTETERLHRIVENLLSFGRLEAGAYSWRLEPVELNDVLPMLVEDFRREPQLSGRALTLDLASALPTVVADREAIGRALWNLVENAAKYSAPESPIRIFARQEGTAIQVGVADQGPGIGRDEARKIFHKFVRGGDAQRAGIRGMGVGLALVKLIAEAHGGSVIVDSAPGRGSTFTLTLPCPES